MHFSRTRSASRPRQLLAYAGARPEGQASVARTLLHLLLTAATMAPAFGAGAQQESSTNPTLVASVSGEWSWEPRSMPTSPAITPPRQLRTTYPAYPSVEATRQGYQGTVVLEGTIDALGQVGELRVVRSPAEIFNQLSLDAVADWAFEPAVREGLPVAVTAVFTIRFSIREAGAATPAPQLPRRQAEQTGRRATALRMGDASLVAPRQLTTELPEYTEAARAAGIEGDVYVEAVVTREGRIADPLLIRGLPDDELNRRALEAITQWTFEPGTRDNQPVDVLALFTVTFRVD